ncbi:MAG: CoA transferase [Alphaproteobacteria bacterium]|nr:CoA transferase [Alphaproteobacteria bacterium]MDP6564672.1 CoA transferase [Alphaproteobacteria bacterium]MDP6816158.1 CoA transferase [Alphaproteobacteria bacterium]
MAGPLAGIRVVDLTLMVAGPVATMMLGDQGADVIKVEPPEGERMRHMRDSYAGLPPSFYSCNRSKRSLALNLKDEAGKAALRRLLATADVLVQNFRPGAIERMGFGEAAVREIKPDIIFASLSGFGESGPYVHQRVYDPVIQALCGLADIQTDRDTGRPKMVRTVIPDKTTSVTAAQAITAALFHRERTGEGQHIRLSMLDTMIAYLWPEGMAGLTYVGRETDPAKAQMGLDLVFETKDGFITAGAVADAEWAGMARAFGRPELIDDPRFRTATDRAEHIVDRRAVMSEEVAKWSTEDILARLAAEDVPCAPIRRRQELMDDPQIVENGILVTDHHPGIGPVRQPRPAARFDRSPSRIHRAAPFLGENSREILAEIGYGDDEIEGLIADGAVTARDPGTTADG